MTLPEFCPSCGMPGLNLTELPDGTLYCNVERAPVLVTAHAVTNQPDVPEVVIASPEPGHLLPDDSHWMDKTHEVIEENAQQPPEAAPVVSGEVRDHASPETAPIEAVPIPNDDGAADDGTGPNIPALKLIIGLCLQAGVMSLDAKNMPLEPPTGWAPPPADQVPEFAAGCAMAVALMIRTFGIEHTDVIALAKQFIDTDTTEEST